MNFKKYFKDNLLVFTVFVTGAVGLIIEVAATRVLSIYFGNTIYTVSGVVGVVLVALSVGYARGGKLADKKPTRDEFFYVIEKAGIALIFLFLLITTILPNIADFFPLTFGPLIVALILFFPPSYFLGMLSPFAIKLCQNEDSEIGVGSISGKIFFWSTLGSLTGTLLTAFVFIPLMGLNAIFFSVTLCILLLGSIARIILSDRRKRLIIFISLTIAIVVLSLIFYFSMRLPPGVLFSKDGIYQRITIKDGTYANRPARFFYQDRSEDNVIFLDGNDLASPYTNYYALYKIFKPNLTHALFIGGGTYVMPTALNKDLPSAQIDVAEIEPSLFQLAQKYFKASNSPNITNHIEDGRKFLKKSNTFYDMIFSDVYYSLLSIPPAYTSKEYFSEVQSKLTPNGIFVANLIGSLSPDKPSFILSEIRTIKSVFPETYVFAVDSASSPNAQNIIVVSVNSSKNSADSSLPSTIPSPLPANMLLHLVPLERYDLNKYPVLDDNYAPVETMIAKFFKTPQINFENLPNTSLWSGKNAMDNIATQVSFGSRSLGTEGHKKTINLIKTELAKTSATVTTQEGEHQDSDEKKYLITNIIARFDPLNSNRIIVGTHYDGIIRAYADKKNPNNIMPGANNSASGVALLLETARVLDSIKRPSVGIDLVFFDGEEGPKSLGAGDLKWFPLGSTYFAAHLTDLYPDQMPKQAVIFDMVCDKNLDIYPLSSSLTSANSQVKTFWSIGKTISPSSFLEKPLSPDIQDDQTALAKAGIPSFLVIDFNYSPWFNTAGDTIDKCSATSLQSVGRTLLQYLYAK